MKYTTWLEINVPPGGWNISLGQLVRSFETMQNFELNSITFNLIS